MNLTKEGIKKLRTSVIEELDRVPEGKRVKLPKDVLEQLLFEEFVYNKKENKSVRLPIWSGCFLQKLDLSEVDFTNVSWSMLGRRKEIDDYSILKDFNYQHMKEFNDNFSMWNSDLTNKGFPVINYSETNARIDFTKSFEFINFGGEVRLRYCNFRDVDFSFMDLSKCSKFIVKDSTIENTKLKIYQGTSLEIKDSNLSGTDLREIELSSLDELANVLINSSSDGLVNKISGNVLINTGLRFVLDANKLSSLRLRIDLNNREFLEVYLSGCYINGELIEDQETREAREAREISNVLEMVRKQR